jgi:predicted N-acetyltransferase YhbS
MTAADTARCGTICYEAFREVAVRHHFPPDFSRPEDAIELVASLHANNKFFSVLAESDGRILGSNFLDERSTVFSVGPITVAPRSRDHRVGHALLTAVLARSEHLGARGVRLVQAGYNTRSMSLYTKLGFRVQAPLALLQGRPLARSADGFDVRMATEADLARCDELCTEVHGHHRTGELREAIATGSARVVIRCGRITGYTTGIGFAGHAVATSNADVKALIANAESFTWTGFLVPLANDELLRWCLEQRLRIVYLLNLMSLGRYEQPRGAYLPSIGY